MSSILLFPNVYTLRTVHQLIVRGTNHHTVLDFTLAQCWFNVCDIGPTLTQHLVNVSSFVGKNI